MFRLLLGLGLGYLGYLIIKQVARSLGLWPQAPRPVEQDQGPDLLVPGGLQVGFDKGPGQAPGAPELEVHHQEGDLGGAVGQGQEVQALIHELMARLGIQPG